MAVTLYRWVNIVSGESSVKINKRLVPWLTDIYIISPRVNFRVEEIAKKRGVSMAQIALAWTLSKDFVSAPIVGTTSLKNLEDLIGKYFI